MSLTLVCFVVLAVMGWAGVGILLWRRPPAEKHRETVKEAVFPSPDWGKLIDDIPAYMVLLDGMGAVVHVNQEARHQFDERLGAVLRHPEVRSLLEAALREWHHHSQGPYSIFSASVTLDVPVSWTVHLALRCVTDAHERQPHILAVLSDRSEARAIDRMRVDFVSHASHELRTPLASISGFIDMLRHDVEDKALRQRSLEIIAQQTDRMKRLIDRLLYLSYVQARAFQRPQTVINVDDVMVLLLDEVAPRFEGDDTMLRLEVEEELFIQADEDELVQVFLNLIENSLKYARKERDILEIRVFGRQVVPQDPLWPGGDGILLGVSDNGKGVDPRHISRLTERFYRVKEDASSVTGSGLGLSIVQQIIERHEGSFRVQSELGQGTICFAWLPNPVLCQGREGGH
ncbi:two-component sensor histidine kinase [Saccharibacter sp. 17.LH.SD]|uniref:ATP-binding protein n=1 Tax=Saccharibacter sp. 17.LH.SD TaxID=2689393 RepID=UPI001370AFAA|nr:ATP-binding protein [Saccharibacter sp. 17.LH.SD]MXV43794.1 two-component sensor histidine kinase [Saccharibacter sp. 17.LH.SD]